MTFTEIGAVVAFLTGAFVLFDRLVSGRPLASLVRRGDQAQGMRDLQCLNTSKSHFIIKRIRTIPNRVSVLRDGSVRAAAESATGRPFSVLIEPSETASFPIVVRDGGLLKEGAPRTPFVLIVSWRKTSSMWLPQVPVFIFSSVRALRAIDEAR